MNQVRDYLDRFDRRLVAPIYDIEKDFGFACMDKVAIAEDLGFASEQSGVVRNVVPHPFRTLSDVESFPWNISLEGTNTKAELTSVRQWCEGKDRPQGGGSFGPLTVAACILGVETFCRMVRKNPAVIHAVMRRVTDFLILLAQEEERSGADCFWLAEPVASLLSTPDCYTFCTSYDREIFDAITVPGILHVCGDTTLQRNALFDTGAQVISLDYCTDLLAYLGQAAPEVVIMGNINPMLLWMGTLEEVKEETETLLFQTRHFKNFIMSSGCQVPSEAPRENVELLVSLTKNYPTWSNEEFRLIENLRSLYFQEGREAFDSFCRTENLPSSITEAALNVAELELRYTN